MLIRDRQNGQLREVQIVWHATLDDPADVDEPGQFPDEYEIVEATDAERTELERAELMSPSAEMTVVVGFRETS
jgi:hypothetical protein